MQTTKPKPRVGVEVLVTVIPEGGRSHLGKTGNLSPSGMLLEVTSPLTVGQRVLLKLYIPGTTRKLEVTGEIIRDAGPNEDLLGYGVQFVDLTPEGEADLERFLAGRLYDSRRD